MEETSEVTFRVNLEGVEEVNAGFERIGAAAGRMGNKVSDSSRQIDTNYRQLIVTTAGLIGNSVQLGDIMDRMAKGQLDVSRGTLVLTMNFLQLGSQLYTVYTKYGALIVAKATALGITIQEHAAEIAAAAAKGIHTAAAWALTAAENARAIASGIANAVMSLGIAVPIMLAATAAIVGGILAYQASIPRHHYEGPVPETRTYLLERGQYVSYAKPSSVTINVYGTTSPRETSSAIMDALRSAGVI